MCTFLAACPQLSQSELEERVRVSDMSSELKAAFCIVFEVILEKVPPIPLVTIAAEPAYDLAVASAILIQEAAEKSTTSIAPTTIPVMTKPPAGVELPPVVPLVSQEVFVEKIRVPTITLVPELVGDNLGLLLSTVLQEYRATTQRPTGQPTATPTLQPTASVSYTHLRAHET